MPNPHDVSLQQLAVRLLELGYTPLRLPPETKAAKHLGWQIELPTEDSLRRAFALRSNIGIRTGDVHADGTCLLAIDVDLEEGELIRCVERAIGDRNVPCKQGKKGYTYLARIDREQKTTKINWERDGKKVAAIDVLCQGAQTVIPPSIHPDTKLPYRWTAGKPLPEVDYRSLPVFGPSLLDEIRGFCKNADDPIYALNDMEWAGVGGGGSTHDTCVRAVGSMVARKWVDEEIHDRIQRAKREACEFAGMPYNWPEAQKIIQGWIDSAREKKFDSSAKSSSRITHGALADRFEDKFADRVRYDRDRGCFYFYADGKWNPDAGHLVRAAIDAEVPPDLRNRSWVKGVEDALKDRQRLSIKQDDWDRDPHLLNTPGGTVDLRTSEMREHRATDLITKMTAVSPAEISSSPLWSEKLADWFGDEEEITYQKRLAGYLFTGETRSSIIPVWTGRGGDGKSVIANLYRWIAGDYGRTSTDTAFIETRQSQHSEEIAWLAGARIVLVNEIAGRWNEQRIKAATGGESLSASFKGKPVFEFVPRFKILTTTNEPPSLRAIGRQHVRRFQVYEFSRPIINPDIALPEKLRGQAPGILRWIIEGAKMYYEDGLPPSPVVLRSNAEYFLENDLVEQFILDELDPDPDAKIVGNVLYESFREYCMNAGHQHIITRTEFTKRLKAKGYMTKTASMTGYPNSQRVYIGLRFKGEGEERF